ncbi:MAG: glycosyltransferase [Endomicrobium sp.]|jgi:rhamnosyltransferase|nr:glycosyltransferase [Endomicrobium sp.]
MKTCAVIVSFNSDKVFRCYESVKEQVDFVIIVDNATSDADIIAKLKILSDGNDKVQLVLSHKNLGIAWALNQGVKYAKEKNYYWLLTLDQDSQLPPETVKNMKRNYGKLPDGEKDKAGVLGCKYVERQFTKLETDNEKILVEADCGLKKFNSAQSMEKDNSKTVQKPRFYHRDKIFKENNLMINSGNFIKMSVFEKAGGFCEKLFIDYVDIEFYYRVLKAGFKNYEAQNVYIIHEFGSSQKKFGFHITNQPPFRRYYIARNGIYFFKKFMFTYPYRALRVMFGATMGGAIKIALFEKDKIKKYKYILLGIKDALFNKMEN